MACSATLPLLGSTKICQPQLTSQRSLYSQSFKDCECAQTAAAEQNLEDCDNDGQLWEVWTVPERFLGFSNSTELIPANQLAVRVSKPLYRPPALDPQDRYRL